MLLKIKIGGFKYLRIYSQLIADSISWLTVGWWEHYYSRNLNYIWFENADRPWLFLLVLILIFKHENILHDKLHLDS